MHSRAPEKTKKKQRNHRRRSHDFARLRRDASVIVWEYNASNPPETR